MIFVVAGLVCLCLCDAIVDLSELQFDQNRRLRNNVLLHSDNDSCKLKVESAWKLGNGYTETRQVEGMSAELAHVFAGEEVPCVAVCLQRGTEESLLPYPMPQYMYASDTGLNKVIELCKSAEIGVISYDDRPTLSLYWMNKKTGEAVELDRLQKGERQMKWHSSFLGHEFEVRDTRDNSLVKNFTVEFDGVIVVGNPGPGTLQNPVPDHNIQNAMKNEWARCNRVKRTFTELGFARGRLPKDIWGSISAYNYNNKDNAAREEWDTKGFFVNWWEVTPFLLGMPWQLKRYWQSRLKDMVEAWIGGIPLENTDIYGIRRYEDGARLLTHVDREQTHAASMIVNVDQVEMREDWMVEIYDFAGRLHEVPMQPGDIVFYEVNEKYLQCVSL
jgi:hypothetical protein